MTRRPSPLNGIRTTEDTNLKTLAIMPSPRPQSTSTEGTEIHNTGSSDASQRDGNLRRRPPEQQQPQQPDARYPIKSRTNLMEPPPISNPKQLRRTQMYANASAGNSSVDMDASSADGRTLQKMPSNSSGGSGDSFMGGVDVKPLEVGNGGGSGSGGSSGLTHNSTAEDWFNTFNKDVGGNESFARYENDSPYYVPKKTNAQDVFRHNRPTRLPPVQYEPIEHMEHLAESAVESNSESYRSVIDDLTVKNQRLKKKLRKLEGTRGRDQGERLFEVRIHDLPEAKKLELESLLRKFSASLDEQESPAQRSSTQTSSNNVTPEMQSQRSVTVPDSGYGSVPRHDQSPVNSSSRGSGSGSGEGSRIWPKGPKNSEINKMKLVVSKLEQLFTGGDATLGDGSQLLQQQNLSSIAAAADELAGGGARHYGGMREAPMMDEQIKGFGTNKTPPSLDECTEAPEQRPTRPLDLDPSRKQVAEDNIEYLTHMTESSQKNPGIPDGWVYLNLIINLAQLHTISVTPPFVRKAIAMVSSRLELSSDGKMVRWKGENSEGTRSRNSAVGSTEEIAEPASDGKKESPTTLEDCEEQQQQDTEASTPPTAESKFQYKPIFYRPPAFEDDSSSATASSDPDSASPDMKNGASEDFAGGSVKKNAGLMIYYKSGNFCTDLSCTLPGQETSSDESGVRYERVTDLPLGEKAHPAPNTTSTRESPLYQAAHAAASGSLAVDEDSEVDMDHESHVIKFSPEFTATHPSPDRPPIEFEVSGIGGVLPADNFAINCQTKYYLLPETKGALPVSRSKTHKKHHKKILHRISKASIHAFYDADNVSDSSSADTRSRKELSSSPSSTKATQKHHHLPRHELLSANTLKLPPSTLPPASYMFATPSDDSSSSEDIIPRRDDDYFIHHTKGLPLAKYLLHSSSSDDNVADLAARPTSHRRQRSPRTVDSAQASASSYDGVLEDFEDEDEDEDEVFGDYQMEVDENSASSSSADLVRVPGGRPNLKRARGSMYRSSESNGQMRKTPRVGDLGF